MTKSTIKHTFNPALKSGYYTFTALCDLKGFKDNVIPKNYTVEYNFCRADKACTKIFYNVVKT